MAARAGYECRAAPTPKAALKALADAPAQLILVDASRAAASQSAAGPCATTPRLGEAWLLAITGRAHSRDRRRGADAGADDYLHRPFTRTELLARARAGVHAAQQRSDDTLLRALMVNVPGAIYRSAWHDDHKLALISDEIERISGYPPANFIASAKRTLMSIVHPDDREQILEAVDRRRARPAVRARVPDRPRRRRDPLGARPRPARPRARRAAVVDGAIFDITERRDAEEALRRREVEAARTEEMRASRARIIEAADTARRKIERDLHDGAQQRLVVAGARRARGPRAARARTRSRPARSSTASARSSREASAELRELARGIHPAVLTERGLGAGDRGARRRAPVPVEIVALPQERLPAGGRGDRLLHGRRGADQRRQVRPREARDRAARQRRRRARRRGPRRRRRRRAGRRRLRAQRARRPRRRLRRLAQRRQPARRRHAGARGAAAAGELKPVTLRRSQISSAIAPLMTQ